MRVKRYSRQRELIYERLQSTNEHPTAETLYHWLKPDNPSLSLGTVYRNLNSLAEDGKISRMPFPVERYDATIRKHPHFSCQKCGGVFDLDIPYDESLDQKAGADGAYQIEGHNLLFFGICHACMEKQ